MSRRQVILLILANIAISLVVSIAVVTVALDRWAANQPVYPTLAVPTRAATVTPLTTDTMYVVQQGDSLSSIAYRFNVPIEDLMRANEITDPDHITVGRRLVIPSGPVPTVATTPTHTVIPFEPPTPISVTTITPAVTSAATATPAITVTAIVTVTTAITDTPAATDEAPANADSIQIESINNAGDLAKESLHLVNAADASISLDEWIVTDDVVHEYQFGDITLEPGGEIVLHTGAGEDTATDIYWNLDAALWKSGVSATLLDRDGEVVYKLSVE